MIVQDKQARVAEDSVLLEMGPFKTRQEVFIGESAAVSESSYNWCVVRPRCWPCPRPPLS